MSIFEVEGSLRLTLILDQFVRVTVRAKAQRETQQEDQSARPHGETAATVFKLNLTKKLVNML